VAIKKKLFAMLAKMYIYCTFYSNSAFQQRKKLGKSKELECRKAGKTSTQ